MRNDVLVVEISGKRPGGVKERPTEKNAISYDHLIISNNSEGYDTDWPIVNVPKEYQDWYIANIRTSESAWYAPMNRSYAIKYAKEYGYRCLVQLDDNIKFLEIAYCCKVNKTTIKRYRAQSTNEMLDDFIDMLVAVLEETNAGMSGCSLAGVANPTNDFLAERYVYSIFALDLERCPDIFQGDFEDDVEFRLKLAQMGVPAIQVVPLRYSKTGQQKNKDLSGCRKAYAEAGVKRGEHMRMLYGDIYSCGMRGKSNCIRSEAKQGESYFKHYIKPFKVGVIVKDQKRLEEKMIAIFEKWQKKRDCKTIVREKKVVISHASGETSDRI